VFSRDGVQFTTVIGGAERVGKRLKHTEYYICGALTGGVAAFAESPIDLVCHG